MNERIIELAEQAGFVYNFDPVTWMKHEKFAELIVRECIEISQVGSITESKIKQHFGVQE